MSLKRKLCNLSVMRKKRAVQLEITVALSALELVASEYRKNVPTGSVIMRKFSCMCTLLCNLGFHIFCTHVQKVKYFQLDAVLLASPFLQGAARLVCYCGNGVIAALDGKSNNASSSYIGL